MGRTPIPLVIWTTAEWAKRPEMLELAEKGHTVIAVDCGIDTSYGGDGYPEPDIILHPAAHGFTEPMWETRLLDVALSAARRRKKATMPPKEPGKKKGRAK